MFGLKLSYVRRSNNRFFIALALLAGTSSCRDIDAGKYTGWQVYGGGTHNIKYSALKQIDTGNVKELKVAWTYHTLDADTLTHSQIQCNPIIINGTLYGSTPQLKIFALDAGTGKEKWVFNPHDSLANPKWHASTINTNRGVTYWEEGDDKRILFAMGPVVYALNAITGKLIPSFGTMGGIDLHQGLDRDEVDKLYIAPTSPGIIFRDLYITGGRLSEAQDAAPGHIRAFDVRTGARKWIFYTIPHPGQTGYESWEDTAAYRFIGGANNWSGFSLDEKKGILYVPVGSASFDFYGGKRKGNDLFANCLVALDAATGKYKWHFQFIHHDVWDRDLPAPPALITIKHNGNNIDALAQTTKQGFVFVLDRITGKPVFPVKEQEVPVASDLQGEQLSPTQPVPSLPKPFVRQSFIETDINNLVADSVQQDIKKKLAGYYSGNMFSPPSKKGTVVFPGFDGGAEWGGPSFDPETGILYVNANEMPWILTMVDAERRAVKTETNNEAGKRIYLNNCMNCHGPDRKGSGNFPSLLEANKKYTPEQFDELLQTGRRMMPSFKQLPAAERKALASFVLEQKATYSEHFEPPAKPVNEYLDLPYSFTGYNKFNTKEGYPAIKPPWGTLSAINLNTGQYQWQVPLGEFPELKAKGIPATGTENYGGSVVTAGGLLFIAATRDNRIRAFNKRNGELLWEYTLPYPGFATPAVYTVKGKQFLVIACGGGKLNTPSGDAYVAFALPG